MPNAVCSGSLSQRNTPPFPAPMAAASSSPAVATTVAGVPKTHASSRLPSPPNPQAAARRCRPRPRPRSPPPPLLVPYLAHTLIHGFPSLALPSPGPRQRQDAAGQGGCLPMRRHLHVRQGAGAHQHVRGRERTAGEEKLLGLAEYAIRIHANCHLKSEATKVYDYPSVSTSGGYEIRVQREETV